MISSTDLLHSSPKPHFKTLHYFLSTFRSVQISAPQKATFQTQHSTNFFLHLSPIAWWKRIFFLLNSAFVMEILDLISRVHFAPFAIRLPRYLKFTRCKKRIIILILHVKDDRAYTCIHPWSVNHSELSTVKRNGSSS